MSRRTAPHRRWFPIVVLLGLVGLVVVVVRFLFGRPLTGHRKTDATFLHPGTVKLDAADRVTAWSYLPEWQRAAVRLGVLAVGTGEWFGYRSVPTLTIVVNAVVTVGAGLYAAHRVRVLWRTRQLRRTVVRPLRAALAHRLSVPPSARVESWLTVPVDYATNTDHPVVIALPQGFDRAAHGDSVVNVALDRLRIAEPIVSWHNYGDHPTVTLRARPAPPELVRLADVERAIATGPDTEIVLGIGCGGSIVSASIELDSPHVALSAPSNAGKSTAAGLIVAQQLGKGAASLVLDIKAESHTWAFGLPNAVVMTRVPQIHSGLIVIWEEVERRQQEVEAAARARRPRPKFTRIWVVAEEMNMTRKALKRYWDLYREEDPVRAKKLPKMSPALDALGNISFAGRSVGVHAILVAQRLTAAATGDSTGAVRENMGIRYMIKPRISTWKMLADGANLPSFIKGTKGRAHVVIDGHAEEVQGAYLTEDELRDMATGGVVTPIPAVFTAIEQGAVFMLSGQSADADGPQVTDRPDTPAGQPAGPPESPEPAAIEPPVPVYLTVEDAVAEGILTGSPESVKRSLRRDAQLGKSYVPQPRIIDGARRYDRDELAAWRNSRPRAGTDSDDLDNVAAE